MRNDPTSMMAIMAHTAMPWELLMTQAPMPRSAVQAYTMTTLLRTP